MKPTAFLKENWRVLLLVVFVLGAVVALFLPGGVMGDSSYASQGESNQSWTEDPINLEYGLGLEGGTRISAPVVGMTAENVDAGVVSDGEADQDRITEIEESLYADEALDLEIGDANVVVHDDGTVSVELFVDDVSEGAFVAALEDADVGASEDDVREGVTQETRNDIIETITLRINEAGLSGGQVTDAEMSDQHYVVTEVPEMGEAELRSILEDRGIVEVVAYHPGGENGTQVNETVLTGDDIAEVDPPRQPERGTGYEVPVQVEDSSAEDFQSDMREMGYTEQQGWSNCRVQDPQTGEMEFNDEQEQHCLLTVVDGEPVAAHSMSQQLGSSMATGDWAESPRFQMGAQEYSEAQALSVNLEAGELRAPLDMTEGKFYSLQPALADQFKTYSLLIGVLSVISVSGVVYGRYQDRRVAAPMILTALAEVFILLGFAALIRMPLDLSHIAGFIAVVGTGVDDLIIIADEVMSEGDVNSQRVFESRFRKAFWVIGAAAATTIIAMSPLAVLSLGDLRGFAIITILGVLIGVLITRPAYGDILRRLLTDK
ncbi:preprotein translocase subunit SecD [Halostagnicola kamekurae]|uniref:Protein-export membrane protein SecD n=1 Tax=Halostagnicola kamekurae TaxID=619731 RepID=A0A1I6S876_9EURY|nr:preprotein translocase subunit SecD [Halostagnicola kamekurae]SFS73132.1 preprotein translocase subunit SecD [Halostagnicola kamekurae]